MRRFDSVERLGQRTDLVDLDEDGVGNAHLDAVTQARGVGNEEVVTDELYLGADLVGQILPAFPIVFGHAVFDGDDRVLAREFREVISHGFRLERAAFAFHLVFAVLEELGRGAVESKSDVVARLVTGLFNRLHDEVQRFRRALQAWGETAFVADIGVVTLRCQFLLQNMEDFSADAHRVTDAFRADWHDHEFLEVDRVVGMRAAIDDVHHRNGQQVGVWATDITVEWQAGCFGSGLGNGERYAEDGVCAEARLVRRTIERNQRLVDVDLAFGIEAAKRIKDLSVDGLDGLFNTLAAIALSAIAQLDCLVSAGGCARWNGSATEGAVFEVHVDLDRGIATAIEDFACDDVGNGCHGLSLGTGTDEFQSLVLERIGKTVKPFSSRTADKRF